MSGVLDLLIPNMEDRIPRVLVVDDTDGNRYAVSHILRTAKMEVQEAKTGAEAMRILERTPQLDLILLDINLPDTTGFEVVRALKASDETKRIPVLHISATAREDTDRVAGLNAGADAYLAHPVEPDVLLATVRALMRVGAAESRLLESAREWRATFDALREPIFLIASDGLIRRCNIAGALLLDMPPRETVGQPLLQMVEHRFGEQGRALASAITSADTERGAEFELGDCWYAVSLDHFRDFDTRSGKTGDSHTVVCILTDITERRNAHDERERLLRNATRARAIAEEAQREAEAANRAKAEFLAVMSHELRTPLNAISGYAELLELGVHGPVSDDQRQYLSKIRANQQRLLRLINDLLSFAKLDSGHVEYDCSPVKVADIVRGLSDAVEPQLQARGIRYIFESCQPELIVWADADKVQQILLNLLSNAIKFTLSGGVITVSCSTVTWTNRPCVAIRVHDTGRGIPIDKLDIIFDAFVQVDKRFVREQEGVGLGLSISRALARGMGGELSADSAEGKGATFTLVLPVERRKTPRTPTSVGAAGVAIAKTDHQPQ